MFLVETHHDIDSVSLRRLRADGFQVIDHSRPRLLMDTLTKKYGGIAAVAVPGVHLTLLDLGVEPGTFKFLCVRIVCGLTSCIATITYQPGSESATSAFFSDLADVLGRLVTFVDPVFIVGDDNVRLDRPAEPNACHFVDIFADRRPRFYELRVDCDS